MKGGVGFVVVLAALGPAACIWLRDPPEPAALNAQALPGVQLPEAWRSPATPGAVESGWLATFADPQLDALVAEALAHNPDLLVAAARVERASAYLKAAGGTLYPQVNAIGNWSGKTSSGSGLNFGGAFVNWELDLWGRVRDQRRAASEQYVSTELAREYARQSIAALVAKSWFLASEARLQKAAADDIAASADKLAQLARDRYRVGVGSDYDVSVAEASLATFRDASEQLGLAYTQSVQALETLVGRYPAAELQAPAALPKPPGPVPAGLPSELLERRPDVLAARRRVASAFYNVEEAKAARLPQISLTGSVSAVSSDLIELKDVSNPLWGIGARAVLPLFTGGALKAQVEARTAEQKEAAADYGRTGAAAFADVERALSATYALEAREPLLARAVTENSRALDLAQTRFRVGSDDLRAVEQQQQKLSSARSSLLRVQSEKLVQRVNLYLALGGGFDQHGS